MATRDIVLVVGAESSGGGVPLSILTGVERALRAAGCNVLVVAAPDAPREKIGDLPPHRLEEIVSALINPVAVDSTSCNLRHKAYTDFIAAASSGKDGHHGKTGCVAGRGMVVRTRGVAVQGRPYRKGSARWRL